METLRGVRSRRWDRRRDPSRHEVFAGFSNKPNGAGRRPSTMRMIACMSPKTEGYLRVRGLDPEHDGSLIRSGLFGVVPQEDALDGELTGAREPRRLHGRQILRHSAPKNAPGPVPSNCSKASSQQLGQAERAKTKAEEPFRGHEATARRILAAGAHLSSRRSSSSTSRRPALTRRHAISSGS